MSLLLEGEVWFRDFRVMYEGSRLLWARRFVEAYDAVNFQQITDSSLPDGLRELDVFISPPPFANFVGLFTVVNPTIALIAWTVLGLSIYVVSHRLLGLGKAAGVVGLLLPMSLYNLYLGQTGFFALGLAAVIHTLCVKDKRVLAGLVAGLTILKPPLFIGLFLWWAIDWKRWGVSIASAAASGIVLIVPTALFGLAPWANFIDAIEARSAIEGVTALQFTLPETVIRLFGHSIGLSLYAYLAYFALGAFLIWKAKNRWEGRTDVLSAAVIIVSMFISPHFLIYDSVMLVIPFAVALHNGASKKQLQAMVALIAGAVPYTVLAAEPIPTLNSHLAVSTFALLAAAWVWVRSVDAELESSETKNAKELTTV